MSTNEYINIRRTDVKLNNIINRAQNKEVVETAAKLLGMSNEDYAVVLKEENDVKILTDFIACETIQNGYSGVKFFLETKPQLTSLEKELCDAKLNSYTSFFKVMNTIPDDAIVVVRDLLNERIIHVKDVNLSKSLFPGVVIFLRILAVRELSITSGIGFPFTRFSDEALLRQYRRDLRKVKHLDESVARFIAAYRMNMIFGSPLSHEHV